LPPDVHATGEAASLRLGGAGEPRARPAETGPDDFNPGVIARAIAADVRAGGGYLSAEDLAACQPRIVPSLEIPYRGYSLHAARGLTAAPTLADVIDRLAGYRFGKLPGPDYFEALVDALQQAYAARL